MTDRDSGESARAHRWFHFFQHLTTFVFVILVILVIDVLSGTDDFFVQWVAAIWGAVLGAHLLNTILSERFGWQGGNWCGARHHDRIEGSIRRSK
ncbi:MAG: 2TM domain-containing protein [Chloroflexi bacterium]|nr:2TM domain-containing protein [Chloroflexota bacterium]